ncbi:YvcK family protein, partial [Candidatus Wolfebacteria bacterium]|nr:YvcK family protein [Candidatus Wolfebacteria bacterium]
MKNKNIVTIGGGTGSFTLLSGLKKYPINLSAIVSMADDGGSTGVLRDELGVLPPGDVRQCLVALSESSETLRELFNYRFESGGLKGHNFGNLFLSALEKISGGFQKGVEESGKILNVKGEVIPVTESDVKLVMKLKNKEVLNGEDEIGHNYEIQKIGIEKLFLTPKPKPNKKAVSAIKKADAIIIGPGKLYCSILPNLLVKEISGAIKKSKAQIIFVCNLFNKKGETDKFSMSDYVKEIEKYIGKNRIDYVIYNIQKSPKE